MNRGDVCLVQFPFTDASTTKLRPVLVISADQFNGGEDVVVVPISSRPTENDPHSVPISVGSEDFNRSGLRYPSAIKWTKPVTLSRVLFKRKLGHLTQATMTVTRGKLIELIS